jgi:hypothetical protein
MNTTFGLLTRLAPLLCVALSLGARAAEPGDEQWDARFGPLGIFGDSHAIAVSGSNVYVGGTFIAAGGILASNIARWNGRSWSTLGSGLNSNVLAIAVSGNEVYVGGNFTSAGGISANRIARWNGSSWSALGIGVNGEVRTIAIGGSNVYVGGAFTAAGASRPTSATRSIVFAPSADEVARRAYSSYVSRGSQPGHDVEHWLAAEGQLLAEHKLI